MNDLTALDLARAQRALVAANAPVFSLAAEIQAARRRHLNGAIGSTQLMDPATRPRDREGAELWDRIQSAKRRIIAYDAQPQTPSGSYQPDEPPPESMSEAELRARIAALRKAEQ